MVSLSRAAGTLVLSLLTMGGVLAAASTPAVGQAPERLLQPDSIRSNLERHAGKQVTVRLVSGEEFTGTVAAVGSSEVHLARLERRDFYDAVIRIDQIAAVIVRMREG